MTIERVRPLLWLDDLEQQTSTGLVDMANYRVRTDFTDTELRLIRTRCQANPGRALVVSVHRSPEAAKQVRTRRRGSERWQGLKLSQKKLDIGGSKTRLEWSAITATWLTDEDHEA